MSEALRLLNLENKISQLIEIIQQIKIFNNPQEDFTTEEAARFIHMSKSSLDKLASNNEITYYKPHGKIRIFKRKDLIEWKYKNRIPSKYELEEEEDLKIA